VTELLETAYKHLLDWRLELINRPLVGDLNRPGRSIGYVVLIMLTIVTENQKVIRIVSVFSDDSEDVGHDSGSDKHASIQPIADNAEKVPKEMKSSQKMLVPGLLW
jgi:hypothetical protein